MDYLRLNDIIYTCDLIVYLTDNTPSAIDDRRRPLSNFFTAVLLDVGGHVICSDSLFSGRFKHGIAFFLRRSRLFSPVSSA